jgi:hypothetical protein
MGKVLVDASLGVRNGQLNYLMFVDFLQAARLRCPCNFIHFRRLTMTKTAMLVAIALALATSAHAQQRVFVSGHGLDTNPCTVTQPCRTFQQAYNIAVANGEIDVIDPAGYGPLNITKGISIQAHGFGGITQTTAGGSAITISVTTSDPVSINGLLIDGGGTGFAGIVINSGPSVTILNSVVRHFQYGILDQTSTNGSNLLIKDTVALDNLTTGITVQARGINTVTILNGITANNNGSGVATATFTAISNSVISNNTNTGLYTNGLATLGVATLAKTVISGNNAPVSIGDLGQVNSYGDNYIDGAVYNTVLTPVTTR